MNNEDLLVSGFLWLFRLKFEIFGLKFILFILTFYFQMDEI